MVRRRVARFLTPALLLLLVPPACALGQLAEVQPPAEMPPTPPGVTSTQPRGPFPICTEPSVCTKQAGRQSQTGRNRGRRRRQELGVALV